MSISKPHQLLAPGERPGLRRFPTCRRERLWDIFWLMRETILVIEDDPNDQFFIKRELTKLGPQVNVTFATDGEQALAYLKGENQFADRNLFPIPSIIFLDLKMPRLTGFEVLAWLKSHDRFKPTPTIVLSSSDLQSDIDKAYMLGANAYLVKPANVEDFRTVFTTTGQFFVELAETPSTQALA